MTTTFQTALQTADYNKLRSTNANGGNSWAGRQFITLCKNTVVFAARVNGAISSSSFAAIVWDTATTGAYTDVEIGETFFLSHTSDIRAAYYRGRVRKAADATHLYVNETSVNITDNDYIFVVYDFDLWDVLSRMISTTQYEDYDIAYLSLPPVVVSLQTAYVNYDSTDAVYRIAFNVSSSYSTDEYSTSSLTYQFTFVAGTYTVHSGALNTAVVTVDFNANTEQWGKLVITDSQGVTTTRRFYIRALGSTDAPDFNFTGAQITGSIDNGWNATVSAWAGVSSVLDQTFTVIWSQEYYNGTLGPLSIANNIDMVGRFHREQNSGRGDPLYSYVADVKFDIEGICTQMQRLQEQDLTTIDKGTAAKWDEISFNTPQRSIVHYLARHSTVLSLCDLTFPDGFDLTYLFQYVPNQGGNVLDAVRGIAAQINANVEFAPDGRIQIVRDTRFLSDKSGVVVVGNFITADFTTVGIGVDSVDKTGRLDAYGISYNAGNVTTCRSRAPGVAQGYAAGQGTLDNQILAATSNQNAAQAELNYRAGQALAIDNLTYSQDWKAATGGYHFLIPSRGQRVTHTLATSTNARGLSFSTSDYWQVVSVNINHNNVDGSREVTTTEELEPPTGDSGDTVPQIAGGALTNPILLQPLDPFPAIPDDPGNYLPDDPTPNPYPPLVPPNTGETVIYTNGPSEYTSRSVVSNPSPVWTDVTPDDLGSDLLRDVSFDRITLTPPIGAYDLSSDSTNSLIRYSTDAFAKPVVWVDGTPFSGFYQILRSIGSPGGVMAYTPSTPGSTVNIAYAVGSGPATASPGSTITVASAAGGGGGAGDQEVSFTLDKQCRITITSAPSYVLGAGVSNGTVFGGSFIASAPVYYLIKPTATNSPVDTPAHIIIDQFIVDTGGTAQGGGTPFTVVIKIEEIAGSGNAQVVYSSDYGVTIGGPVTVGATPGLVGAFDSTPVSGGATIAAAAGQVKLATTVGGSYSNAPGGTLAHGNPVALVIPVRRLDHGAYQNAVSDPDYLLGASADNTGASLWKVAGASGTRTDITPVSGCTIAPHMLTTWQTASLLNIQTVINDAGTYKLYSKIGAASWVFRRTVTNPVYLRYKRTSPAVLYLIDGDVLYVSTDHGANWRTRTSPSSTNGVAMDMYT